MPRNRSGADGPTADTCTRQEPSVMDRRTFVNTVAGGCLATPFLARAQKPVITTTGVAINFVGKIHGANLTTKPGHPLLSALWIEWDWIGWVRPQLDCAVALGC